MIELIRTLCDRWFHHPERLAELLEELGDRLIDEEGLHCIHLRLHDPRMTRTELHLDRESRQPVLLRLVFAETSPLTLATLTEAFGNGRTVTPFGLENPDEVLFFVETPAASVRFRLVATPTRDEGVSERARVAELTLQREG